MSQHYNASKATVIALAKFLDLSLSCALTNTYGSIQEIAHYFIPGRACELIDLKENLRGIEDAYKELTDGINS